MKGLWKAYLRPSSGLSQVYIKYILSVSQSYIRHILVTDICQVSLRFINLKQISGIYKSSLTTNYHSLHSYKTFYHCYRHWDLRSLCRFLLVFNNTHQERIGGWLRIKWSPLWILFSEKHKVFQKENSTNRLIINILYTFVPRNLKTFVEIIIKSFSYLYSLRRFTAIVIFFVQITPWD